MSQQIDVTESKEVGDRIEDRLANLRPTTASNVLLFFVALTVITFIVWASLTELDVHIRGQGRVVPSSQLQVVSNLEGGIVQQIFVSAGDNVAEGDPLMSLDPTETGSNLEANQVSLDALQAKIARLEAEVAGREPNFPTGGDPALREQVEIERALHASRMADLASLTNAAMARVEQTERAVAEARATLDSRRSAAEAARRELDILRPLVERGIEPQLSLVQAESRAAVAQSDVSAAEAGLTRAQAAVMEARSALNQQRQDWRARAADELAAAQSEMASRRRTLPALQSRVDRTTIRAPMTGRVNRVLKSTVGGTVTPGEPLVEMVPSGDALIVEARIKPSDIGFVSIGQQAKVNITAYDPTVYGGIEGEVVTISPDSTVDERTGETWYEVEVKTQAEAITDRYGNELQIGPGMVADVNLLGEKRKIISYILRPITRLSQTAFRE
ncbi:secretion protein HlyD [Pacificimonas flava]|uniref:Membrane fusion protein (MFP) family protein n=2 Tax=Pacificimonas TaxID=1960290 RepID=A0A219B850_9SPHN|nr:MULTISPECIES: HlyD family type I secretion periplasmic adaptor subunit [Pacificimonas]MBZ6378401.1 HlyD family type I secretion periplasmic adaptor subunit [Pacificimonas aurantium]OWV34296.1 secretion protein HlyD [Pacificimonas flava]